MPAEGGLRQSTFDRMVSYRVALLRYESGLTRDLVALYEAAVADARDEAARLAERIASGRSVDRRRLARLLEQVGELSDAVTQLRAKIEERIEPALVEAAEGEIATHRAIFRDVGASFAQPSDAAVATALMEPIGGNVWTDRLAADLRELDADLRNVASLAFARGYSMPEVARQLGRVGGIVETYRGRLVAIARTEVQRVANTTAMRTYEANADVVGGVQYLATLDSRTCVVCGARHDKTWSLAEARTDPEFRRPPLHPRCRCFLAPVTRDFADMGLGEPRRGRLARGPSFASWLRRQPADDQIDVLGGREQRRLWLSGVPLSAFSVGARPLNVGELRARFASP